MFYSLLSFIMKHTLFITILAFFLFYNNACDSCINEQHLTSCEYADFKGHANPCCEVHCHLSSCKSMGFPGQYTCTGGLAGCLNSHSCNNNPANCSHSTVIIESSPDKIPLFNDAIHYIANDLNNAKAAQALRNIKQLFLFNNYRIESPIEVEKYCHNLKVYADFIETQPSEVIEQLFSFEAGEQ